MVRSFVAFLLSAFLLFPLHAQTPSDPVAQAISQGDLYQSKRKYDLALDAYRKADKLSHHSSAMCYLKMAAVERKTGDFSSALDDAKRAVKASGDNKTVAVQAHLVRATLLTQMAGKSTDKKLREAEDELRQALALDSASPLTHFDLGVVLLKQERDPEGIAELSSFISMPNADSTTLAEARRFVANPIRARAPFAPDFSFTTLEHQNVSNTALHGKVVLLDFWGTWCPPCRESAPTLRNLNKKYAGKPFQLVGISSDDDEDVWRTFIEAQHMDWSEYIDASESVLQAFKIESFPTYVVLDKDGVIRLRQSGFGENTGPELEDAINKALKRESDPKLAAAAAAESASPVASSPAATSSGGNSSAASVRTTPSRSPSTETANSDTSAATATAGIEGVLSGNVYKNPALGMSYEFPQGWTAAKPDSLHAINDRTEAAAKATILQQHPELANSLRIATPKVVFYASKKGEWDGQRISIPSIRITAIPSRLDDVNLDTFQQTATNMATATGMKIAAPAAEFHVNKHQFARADFERSVGALRIYQSFVQSIAGDYLITVEIYASSHEELQQAAASLQAMSITDEDP